MHLASCNMIFKNWNTVVYNPMVCRVSAGKPSAQHAPIRRGLATNIWLAFVAEYQAMYTISKHLHLNNQTKARHLHRLTVVEWPTLANPNPSQKSSDRARDFNRRAAPYTDCRRRSYCASEIRARETPPTRPQRADHSTHSKSAARPSQAPEMKINATQDEAMSMGTFQQPCMQFK